MKMNTAHLLKTEAATAHATTNRLAGVERELPKILDTLFLFMHCTGPQDKSNSDRRDFHSLAWNTYLEVPYTIRCCYLNTTLGYYGQSIMLLRHLLEALAKVEYAKRNNSLSERIWTAPSPGVGKHKPLSIHSIFKGIGKSELYKRDYGHLSVMTHGSATLSMFRLKRSPDVVTEVRQAMAYDEFYCTYVINTLLTIVLSFLYRFPIYFPEGWKHADADTKESRAKSVLWLETARDDLLRVNPRYKGTLDRLGELIQRPAIDTVQ